MGTPSTGDRVVVTPIYWNPTGHGIPGAYKQVINTYWRDAVTDSEKTTNVFSTLFEYSGSNGAINYRFTYGPVISDTNPLPTNGCTVSPGAIYADGTGYNACLDDAQIIAQAESVVSARSLPRDYGHVYVVFLPKHVESCFNSGSSTSGSNACTINYSPSAAYCAYHSMNTTGMVYANMPWPIYSSGTGYSCTDESLGGGIQSPNGNVDADVEISPTSHEVSEAITDPDVSSGWYDDNGFENGDECAYVYGTLGGAAGAHYNQTINGHHYLTQEEPSNRAYAATGKGCLQTGPQPAPALTNIAPKLGSHTGGTSVVITGTNFAGATAVKFGTLAATTFKIIDNKKITATAPAHAVGTVDVRITTSTGTTPIVANDKFTYN